MKKALNSYNHRRRHENFNSEIYDLIPGPISQNLYPVGQPCFYNVHKLYIG